MTPSPAHSERTPAPSGGAHLLASMHRPDMVLAAALRGNRTPYSELPLRLQILRDELRASVARRLPWSRGSH